MTLFKKAVKHEAKLRLAIAGPSGSGKTYTALSVATNLGAKVALVDTEYGSASKYADIFEFDVAEMSKPFHPDKYAMAIEEAGKAGYDVIILDSLSHAWNGPGGVLEIVDQASKRFRGNSYAGWQEGTPVHNRLIEAIVSAPLHVIGTMRSKTDYVLADKNGKKVPQKVGMAPVQRDGFEFEFDVFLEMDVENNAIVSKTRCSALTGAVISKPGADLADTLREWLQGAPTPDPDPDPPKATEPEQDPTPDPTPTNGADARGAAAPQAQAERPRPGQGGNGNGNGYTELERRVVTSSSPDTFFDAAVELCDRYDHVNAAKAALKKIGYEALDKTAEGRVEQLRHLYRYAIARDAGMSDDDAMVEAMPGAKETA